MTFLVDIPEELAPVFAVLAFELQEQKWYLCQHRTACSGRRRVLSFFTRFSSTGLAGFHAEYEISVAEVKWHLVLVRAGWWRLLLP